MISDSKRKISKSINIGSMRQFKKYSEEFKNDNY